MTRCENKMFEYTQAVARRYREQLGEHESAVLHNLLMAGLRAVYDGNPPNDETDIIRRLDRAAEFVDIDK